jgi:hypothetical protein
MISLRILLVGLALAGCQQNGASNSESVASESVAKTLQPFVTCAVPSLVMADSAQMQSKLLDETSASFTRAYNNACRKGVLRRGGRALVDPKAPGGYKLFLVNAPEANAASIYLSEVDGDRTVLEYPFLTTDGKTQVPTANELEEAIYCAVVGATPEVQESSGRCLVD